MEQLTTYTIKSKNSSNVWVFKYNLNGDLNQFQVLDGTLSEKQIDWLFKKGNFPINENQIKEWQKNLKENFEIIVGVPDLSFEALWNLYDHKVSKQDAIKYFNRLKQGDIIKCFTEVPYYLQYLKQNPSIGKLHLATYISKRRFDDERPILKGKNFNPLLTDLATQKTNK